MTDNVDFAFYDLRLSGQAASTATCETYEDGRIVGMAWWKKAQIRRRRSGYRDEPKWASVHDAMIDAMIRLEKALRPHLDKLQL